MTTEENKANGSIDDNESFLQNIHKETVRLSEDLHMLEDNAEEIRTDIDDVHKELVAHIESMKTKTLTALNATLVKERNTVQVRLDELHNIIKRIKETDNNFDVCKTEQDSILHIKKQKNIYFNRIVFKPSWHINFMLRDMQKLGKITIKASFNETTPCPYASRQSAVKSQKCEEIANEDGQGNFHSKLKQQTVNKYDEDRDNNDNNERKSVQHNTDLEIACKDNCSETELSSSAQQTSWQSKSTDDVQMCADKLSDSSGMDTCTSSSSIDKLPKSISHRHCKSTTSVSSGYCFVGMAKQTPNTTDTIIDIGPVGLRNMTNSCRTLDEITWSGNSTPSFNRSHSDVSLESKHVCLEPDAKISNIPAVENHERSDFSLALISKFEAKCHRTACVISDITVMPDHRIILADHYHNNIQLFSKDLTFVCEQKCPYPMSVCRVDKHTIAVSLRRAGHIAIYEIGELDMTLVKKIRVICDYYTWNVIFKNGKLFVMCDENNIHIIDLDGNEQTVIRSGVETERGYIRYFDVNKGGDRLYLCEQMGLRCIDNFGKTVWLLTRGDFPDIDQSRHASIIEDICCYKNTLLATHWTHSKIFEISQDGHFLRDILTEHLEFPRAMSIYGDTLIVTQFNQNMAASKKRTIKVFNIVRKQNSWLLSVTSDNKIVVSRSSSHDNFSTKLR